MANNQTIIPIALLIPSRSSLVDSLKNPSSYYNCKYYGWNEATKEAIDKRDGRQCIFTLYAKTTQDKEALEILKDNYKSRRTERHHILGREGDLNNDISHIITVHEYIHRKIEDKPQLAQKALDWWLKINNLKQSQLFNTNKKEGNKAL